MIVGLTGGIGCGKSVVADIFQQLGVTVVSADKIGRQLLSTEQSILTKVVQHLQQPLPVKAILPIQLTTCLMLPIILLPATIQVYSITWLMVHIV